MARLRREDRGQDLAEYTMLLALILLIVLGVVIHLSGGINGIWTAANSSLATANTAAGSSVTAAAPGGGSGSGGGGDQGDGGPGH